MSQTSEKDKKLKKKRSKPHFKLNFYLGEERGKSYINPLCPDLRVYVVTPKFYARHEAITGEVDEDLINKVHLAYEQFPKDKRDYPETENQRIGWFNDRIIEGDRNDRRLNHPHVITPMIKTMMTILNSKI